MRYPLLSSPYTLKGLTLRNRTVMSPMSSGLGRQDGSVSEAQIAFYRERAEGGVGLIIVEFTGVNRRLGLAEPNQLSLDSRDNLAGHQRLVKAIAAGGARTALQLHAPGRHCDLRTIEGLPAGPSAEVSKRDGTKAVARALMGTEILELIESFGRSAELAIEAGYEAIEIHGAHGYLPMAFLSPLSNRRDDDWGGDFDRRLKFVEGVIRRVRQAMGPDRPLLYRLSSSEHLPGGLTIENMAAIAQRLVAAGVDCLDVSTGTLAGTLDMAIDPMSMPEGWRFEDSRRIRQATGAPTIGIGPVRWPQTAEDALSRGDADLVCLGRPLLADAEWAKKAVTGHEADIRPCTNCNWCFARIALHQPIGCAEAPRTGRELAPVSTRRVGGVCAVVIGGGPGGMAAALELDSYGFDTHLFEAQLQLGGGLIASAAPPLKDKLLWYLDHLRRQLAKSEVKIHLGRKADPAIVSALNPSVIIVATGALPLQSLFDGAKPGSVIMAYDLLAGDVELDQAAGATIAVYGGGETGCETAEFLADLGYRVQLITRSDRKQLARSAETMYRKHLLQRLAKNGRIEIVDHATVTAFDAGIMAIERNDQTTERLAAGLLVIAQGRDAGSALAEELEKAGLPVTIIGDALRIGRIGDAVHGAHAAVQDALETGTFAARSASEKLSRK